MLRSSLYLAAGVALIGSTSLAQRSLKGQLRPITAPVKYAGVYHVGTGTWTHGTQGSVSATGAGIIYDNTCPSGYYGPLATNAICIDEGRLPSTTSVVVVNANGLGNDSEVGTQNSYTVDGFQIAWCATDIGPRNYNMKFYEAYDACTVATNPPVATFALALPGGTGALACWQADVDLCATSDSFSMLADADGAYTSGAVGDTFGWSFELTSAMSSAVSDGWIIAGGRFQALSPNQCSSSAAPPVFASGSDGTVFDSGTFTLQYPANQDAFTLACGSLVAGALPEAGSGMGMQDRFRLEGSIAPNCYWFGGANNPVGSWHLQLYASSVDLPSGGPMINFCDPGSGPVMACPCSNPPAGSGLGCDNSSLTGGGSISATGNATVGSDTLVITTAGQVDSPSIVLQGDATVPGGAIQGQGIRCVGGNLFRLYIKFGVGGSITAPQGGDPTISAVAAGFGDIITPGSTRYYSVYYRDPTVLGGCPPLSTYNTTNAGEVLWN
jgi:hypothetical protein